MKSTCLRHPGNHIFHFHKAWNTGYCSGLNIDVDNISFVLGFNKRDWKGSVLSGMMDCENE